MNKELAFAIAIIIGALSTPFVKIIFELIKSLFTEKKEEESLFVTHQELSKTRREIFNDVNNIIEKTKSEMATKESVNDLKEDFQEVKKNIFDMQKDIKEMCCNIAVLLTVVEKRKEPRE